MMKLKKFNELFDDENLKGQNEIDYLTGNIYKNIKNNIDRFDNDNIAKFVSRLSEITLPFFKAFVDAGKFENGNMKLQDNSVVYATQNNDWYFLVVEKKDNFLSFEVKINSLNDYDIRITSISVTNEDFSGTCECFNLTFDDIRYLIVDVYLPCLENLGFNSLLNYNINNFIIKNN
jgi:hypothetical protein